MAASANSSFANLTNLSCSTFGAQVLFATDEWFAEAPRLLLPQEPIFVATKYTEFGKWMDGWETRRKRKPGHDWCVIRLGLPGIIRGVYIDTAFFTGNNAPRFSLQAANLKEDPTQFKGQTVGVVGLAPTDEEIAVADEARSHEWDEVISMTDLQPGYSETSRHYFTIANQSNKMFTHVRLNIFPDGGVARLRVLGDVHVDWTRFQPNELIDLAAAANGAVALGCSNKHYGEPKNLLMPGRGVDMSDGWETARKQGRPSILKANSAGLLDVPGSDWAVLQLGTPGIIERLQIDTLHFKGNFPESCQVEAVTSYAAAASPASGIGLLDDKKLKWQALLPRTKLEPHKLHTFTVDHNHLQRLGDVSHLRLTIYPDGGVKRLRAWGKPAMKRSRV